MATAPGATTLAWVANIEDATVENDTFRTVLFTGKHAQLTVMSLRSGEEIGWEMHPDLDQFLRVEQGTGRLDVGCSEDTVDESHEVAAEFGIVIPGGTWHNVVNTGDGELKLYSLYAA